MLNQDKHIYELENIKNKIIKIYNPDKIILFGSLAKGVIRQNSDIDLCIVKNVDDKRKLISDIYINIDSLFPFDIIVYTVKEWEDNIKDKASFAYKIFKEGKLLHGRYY